MHWRLKYKLCPQQMNSITSPIQYISKAQAVCYSVIRSKSCDYSSDTRNGWLFCAVFAGLDVVCAFYPILTCPLNMGPYFKKRSLPRTRYENWNWNCFANAPATFCWPLSFSLFKVGVRGRVTRVFTVVDWRRFVPGFK